MGPCSSEAGWLGVLGRRPGGRVFTIEEYLVKVMSQGLDTHADVHGAEEDVVHEL